MGNKASSSYRHFPRFRNFRPPALPALVVQLERSGDSPGQGFEVYVPHIPEQLRLSDREPRETCESLEGKTMVPGNPGEARSPFRVGVKKKPKGTPQRRPPASGHSPACQNPQAWPGGSSSPPRSLLADVASLLFRC